MNDTTRHDTTRYDTIRYDTIWYFIARLGKFVMNSSAFTEAVYLDFLPGSWCFTHYCNAHMHTHTETVFKSYICVSTHLCHPGPFSITAELFLFLAYQRDNIPDFKHTATSCKLQECLSLFWIMKENKSSEVKNILFKIMHASVLQTDWKSLPAHFLNMSFKYL